MARPVITCSACGEYRTHRARGWCNPCYRRWINHDKPQDGPPPLKRLQHADVIGTVQGWDWHMRNGIESCGSCRAAHNAKQAARYHTHGTPRPVALARHYTEPSTDWSEQERAAALGVADLARDADDCRHLLQALGLLPYEVQDTSRIGGDRAVA